MQIINDWIESFVFIEDAFEGARTAQTQQWVVICDTDNKANFISEWAGCNQSFTITYWHSLYYMLNFIFYVNFNQFHSDILYNVNTYGS